MIAWSRIVCAVDFSDASRAALEHAAELARRFHAELVLVHVWKGSPGEESAAAAPPTLTDQEEAELEGKLESWEREAEQIAGREVRTLLTSGSPAPEIARIASEEKAELVVTGTRGRTGFERAVLGSVAEDIVRHAPCAVLIVKGAREWDD
jgi:nucleotide-binding universal stress UspA family protein